MTEEQKAERREVIANNNTTPATCQDSGSAALIV